MFKFSDEQRKEISKKGGLANIERLKTTQSQFMKDYWANLSPEERAARKKRAPLDKQSKAKLGNSQKKVNKDPLVKARKSAAQKAAWAKLSPEERSRRTRPGNIARLKAQDGKRSSIELMICEVLDKHHIEYKIQVQVENWLVDIYISKSKLIIECDGDYWHSLPQRIKRDKDLDQWCLLHGHKILHLKESDIRKNPEQTLILALKEMKYGKE